LTAILALALAVAAPPSPAGVPSPVALGLARAVRAPGARLEVADYQASLPPGCAVARADPSSPVAASGRVALRLFGALPGGAPCDGWAWARVRLFAPALVTTRPVRAGEPLAEAVASGEREIVPGRAPLARLPAGAVAERPLASGLVVEERDLRTGPRPGEPVAVVVRLGGLLVEQPGHAVACSRGRACALMPSGRRVEGTFEDGRIVVESP
jgi:hypothetical protein